MSDYQAIYDAVRSRITGGNVGEAVADTARTAFDVSWEKAAVRDAFVMAADEQRRPSAVYRPAIMIDGNQWCALYGANLQDGVAGFGDSPALAMTAFDEAWFAKLTSPPRPSVEPVQTVTGSSQETRPSDVK